MSHVSPVVSASTAHRQATGQTEHGQCVSRVFVALVLPATGSFALVPHDNVPLCRVDHGVLRQVALHGVALFLAVVAIEDLTLLAHRGGRTVVSQTALTLQFHLWV